MKKMNRTTTSFDIQGLKVKKFEIKNIPEYLEFAYEAYRANNPTYSITSETQEDFNASTTAILTAFIQAADHINHRDEKSLLFNSYLEDNGRMVSAIFNCDIDYFIETVAGKIHLPESMLVPRKVIKAGEKGVIAMRHCVWKDYLNAKIYTKHMIWFYQ
jgi:hypothetical protein